MRHVSPEITRFYHSALELNAEMILSIDARVIYMLFHAMWESWDFQLLSAYYK